MFVPDPRQKESVQTMTVTEPRPITTDQPTSADIEAALAIGLNGDDVISKVPFPMRDWSHVPAERYYSREFYDLEKEKLWPHVWQMAAREQEIPEAGDFVEYEIVGQSLLIVRQVDGSIKALHNACRHRATELGKGCGRFPGNQIVCPFHGWRWKTDGQISHVFGREGFDETTIRPEEIALREAQCDTWEAHLGQPRPRRAAADGGALPGRPRADPQRRGEHARQVVEGGHSQLQLEARPGGVLRGWHVKQTHPQLYTFNGDADSETNFQNVDYTPFRNGHGRFQSGDAKSSYGGKPDFLEAGRLLQEGQDAMTLERDIHVFEGVAGGMDTTSPEYAMKRSEPSWSTGRPRTSRGRCRRPRC